jgi:DNA-binding HxlR family transcriptional regulator
MSMTSAEGTIATQVGTGHDPGSCGAREVLDRVGDKWSLYVIKVLGGGTKRFSDLRREVDPITPRMLTVTLRTLERDGLISRKVYPVVPPRVEYTLTQMGETLVEAVAPLIVWANTHLAEIEEARVAYDLKLDAVEDAASNQ